jgi:hypothetical protein
LEIYERKIKILVTTMFKTIVSFLSVVHGLALMSAPFLISEIYGNGVGVGKDDGKEWIEIFNGSENSIVVERLELEILLGHEKKPVFKQEVVLEPPVILQDFLVIAQKEHLSLNNYCLRPRIRAVIMPGFSISNKAQQTLCVRINGEQSCATLSSRLKFNDGISLYRSVDDGGDLWLNEPCHLVDGVFATPGFREKSCKDYPNLKDEILYSCGQKTDNKITVKKLVKNDRYPPKQASMAWGVPSTIHFFDHDKDDQWLITTCFAPDLSTKICQKALDTVITTENNIEFLLPTISFPYAKFFIRLRDTYGYTVNLPGKDRHLALQTKEPLCEIRYQYDEGKIEISLNATAAELPINISVYDNNDMVHQSSIIEPIPVSLVIPADGKEAYTLSYASKYRSEIIALKKFQDPSLPISCQSGRSDVF